MPRLALCRHSQGQRRGPDGLATPTGIPTGGEMLRASASDLGGGGGAHNLSGSSPAGTFLFLRNMKTGGTSMVCSAYRLHAVTQ